LCRAFGDLYASPTRDAAGGRCRTVSEQGYLFSIAAGSTEPQWETTFQYLNEFGLMNKVFSMQKQRFGLIRNGKMHTISMGGGLAYTIRCLPETTRFLFTALPWSTYPQAIRAFRAMLKYSKKVDSQQHNFEALAQVSNTRSLSE